MEHAGIRLSERHGELILPGDHLASLTERRGSKRAVVRIGGGITQRKDSLLSSKAGYARHEPRRNKLWVENNQRRYEAAEGDMIIGIVQEKYSEEYRLEINGSDSAMLPGLAFEGATKKNKPNISAGGLVYCQVSRASKNMETEVCCVETGSAKSWIGGETLFGELKGGNMIGVSIGLARRLLGDGGVVLQTIGRRVAFQCAVGVNGRVWIEAGCVEHTLLVCLAVQKADVMGVSEWNKFVDDIFRGVK